ncbi:MAG: hypothetical protein E7645_04485 [Ruminococcaceae bacterium]|nr:hypothetical protein [Oscillospiraceae bacterium]
MIALRIKYADTTVNINFPCTDNTLFSKLMELHATDHEGDPFFVDKVIEPQEIASFFESQFIDLDEVNYHSYILVRPAYYEVVLTDRYMQDPQSVEMLDLIFDTVDYDFASCWSDIFYTNIRNQLRPILSGKNNTVSSSLRGWERSIKP